MADADGAPLHILIVHVWFWPHVGGGDQHVEMLGRELVKMGHRVSVWCADVPEHEEKQFNRGGIEVIRIPASRILAGVDPVVSISDLSLDGVDVVHLHDTLPILIRKTLKRAVKSHIPVVTTYHNDYIKNGFIANTIKRFRWAVQGRNTLNSSQARIALTPYFDELLKSKGIVDDIDIIPNGFSPIDKAPERPLTLPNNVDNSRPLLSFIGRLSEQKGLDVLMEAWEKLATEEDPGFDIAIAGKGELEDWLIDRISIASHRERIHKLGLVSEAEKRWLLEESTGIVIPSRFEGLPTVMLEAMHAKAPVIMANVNDLGRLITEPGAGLSIPPGDSEALATAMSIIAHSEQEERKKWGESGYNASIDYMWSEITKDVLAIYHRVLEESV
ncbi:MAG TPA: glycosyltransferase family 4 protein [Candidatus Thalassarchaeaceae archaeon]|jgi:glycosyltransferase involved in cell wall biosynthesis|nr:glycosyltransferase family 4 protein [Candidatus Thalassarchaeaceae archaeon]HJO42926.1 glycosyltransferase family 4 protein [Candidatus Thalassarchaeaceae archaeon]